MKYRAFWFVASFALSSSAVVAGPTGPSFYGDPPDAHHPWAVHDGNRPQPKIVTPGTFSSDEQPGKPPSDAVILFDGTDLSKWVSDKGEPAKWEVHDGIMQVAPSTGEIRTKDEFGDCQLHIEWAEPEDVKGRDQGRGNSGIFLMGRVEVQVLDSYNNITYADGHAGAVYGVMPPMANALRPPGHFQVYDVVFRRPIYREGQEIDPGYVTLFINGVLVQDHARLEGPTGHRVRSKPQPFPEKGPLSLQDHGNPVRFRNIWYRPLPPRPIEGGMDGFLTTEATMAKRKEIAASIRQDVERLSESENPLPRMLRLMESLVYQMDEPTLETAQKMAEDYVSSIKRLSGDTLQAKKDEVLQVRNDFRYLQQFKIVPADFQPAAELQQIVREQRWERRRR